MCAKFGALGQRVTISLFFGHKLPHYYNSAALLSCLWYNCSWRDLTWVLSHHSQACYHYATATCYVSILHRFWDWLI